MFYGVDTVLDNVETGVDTSDWPDVKIIAAKMKKQGGPDLSKITREAES